jgi:phage tail sheath protein FI
MAVGRDTFKGGAGEDYYGNRHPGVYLERRFGLPQTERFLTGVPAFLGLAPARKAPKAKPNHPKMLSLWSQFSWHIGTPDPESYLAYAVRGFFENGGQICYVVPLADNGPEGLEAGLKAIASLDTVDLVCAPEIVRDRDWAYHLQQIVVDHCQQLGDRFAILDSRLRDKNQDVEHQWSEIDGSNGAIYYPWVKVAGFDGGYDLVPPCGHIAGIFARSDRTRGVHKAPANEVLEGVVGLERVLTNTDQDELNPRCINCLRSLTGRGIRVWGARTLSSQSVWTYVNVRRVFLTLARWIQWNMRDIVFEPNTPRLWARIEREVTTYLKAQFEAGALKGRTPEEAFYVKCNADTNRFESPGSGRVVTEIGLAPNSPYEFVVVRLIHGERGVSIDGPVRPDETS